MVRLQLFEFEDKAWLPIIFRDMITDAIQYDIDKYKIYDSIAPMLQKTMKQLKVNHIIDLCSGGSGPLLRFYKMFESDDFPIKVTFTDKYPNTKSIQKIESYKDNINYIDRSIDAMDIPSNLKGIRTMFTSFHHFPPEQAKLILQNAINNNSPIGIFEFTERKIVNLILSLLLTPILMFIVTPFIKPFTFPRFFWTYIIPIVPILDTWDGFISNLRTYTPDELRNMVDSIGDNGFLWQIGKIDSPMKPLSITYLIGYPEKFKN